MRKFLQSFGGLATSVMMAIAATPCATTAAPATANPPGNTAQAPARPAAPAAPAPPAAAPAQEARPARPSASLYSPIPITGSNEITDTLTDKDIPTGSGGFARDYALNLKAGDQVVIDLSSDQFDTILLLIGPDGATVGENDDGPDGTTNSLLFARITRPGNYIVRVSPYAGQGTGSFKLKVTRLRPEG